MSVTKILKAYEEHPRNLIVLIGDHELVVDEQLGLARDSEAKRPHPIHVWSEHRAKLSEMH
mgnify:CR=1 FL=1